MISHIAIMDFTSNSVSIFQDAARADRPESALHTARPRAA
jgi:hypothetical protein